MKVVVTGSGGFVGAPLIDLLASQGHDVLCPVREGASASHPAFEAPVVRSTLSSADWRAVLGQGVDCVVHLIGRSHHLGDATSEFDLYWRDNVSVTRALMEALGSDNAPRFVYLSSVKSVGETTRGDPISDSSPAAPTSHYGMTKRAAELELTEWAVSTRRHLVILRPPLVYGSHVRGNFIRLLDLANRGVPLPFGAIHNRRSLIYISNLLDAVTHAMALGNREPICVPVADGDPVSTRELIGLMRETLGLPQRLIPLPPTLLRASLKIAGLGDLASRVLDDLEVDNGAADRLLGWSPAVTTTEGVIATTRWYASAIGANPRF